MVSAVDRAKRALVSLLKKLAKKYDLRLDVVRDSPDLDVHTAFRKLSRKSHPDRGGAVQDQSSLNTAYEACNDALKISASSMGRPKKNGSTGDLVSTDREKPDYNFRSIGVLLTFQKFADFACWFEFLAFVKAHLKDWGVRQFATGVQQWRPTWMAHTTCICCSSFSLHSAGMLHSSSLTV